MKSQLKQLSLGIIGLTCCAFLPGCNSLSKSQKPTASLPEQFTEPQEQEPLDSSKAINPLWWKEFNDSTLDHLIELALLHNTDLQAAAARVENAQAVLREVNGAIYPTINVQTSSLRNRLSQKNATPVFSGVPALRNTNNISLTTAFEVDVFGKLRTATQIARTDLLASRYAQDSIKLALIGQLAQSYFALINSGTQIKLLNQVKQNEAQRLQLIQQRYEKGLSSQLDIHQIEGNLSNLDAKLATERQNYALIKHQLALLTGLPELQIDNSGLLSNVPLPPVPPAGIPSTLLEARPDIQQAEALLASAQGRVAYARAAYFPSIGLTGSWGSESKDLSDLFSAGANIWSLGINTALIIFDAGRRAAVEAQANAQQKEFLANYIRSVHIAFKEVNDALATLRESRLFAEAQHARTLSAQKSLTLTENRYKAGYVGYIDVLEAQTQLLDALQNEINAKNLRLNATVSLFKALGGGWKNPISQH